MIAQAGLSILLGGIIVYAWAEYRRAPAIGLVAIIVAAAGLYFVWLPSHATWLAETVGIGRGVDLILYVWVVISLLVLMNLHLKLRSQMELITALTREVAIADALPGAMRSNQDDTTAAAPTAYGPIRIRL
jgi:small membrane protein